MTSALIKRSRELIAACNNAKTEHEHALALATLEGWRLGVADAGGAFDWTDADLHHIGSDADRPMCMGVFLDWKPASDAECACPQHGHWIGAESVLRAAREFDIAMHGECAAERPRLIDVEKQVLEHIARAKAPEAYALVPIEPTEAMLELLYDSQDEAVFGITWEQECAGLWNTVIVAARRFGGRSA